MAKALYLVIRSRDSWWVDFEGASTGPYESREAAALEARTLARARPADARESQVLVPDQHGSYWVIWSSAHEVPGSAPFAPHRYAR